MSSKGLSNRIKLSSYDDMFSAENDGNATSEAKTVEGQIVEIPLSELHTFENHPFRVVDDENMEEMVESVKKYGVLVPAIARPRAEGGYELISGHRRKRATELAGLRTIPVRIMDLSDEDAVSYMIDSNIQRENVLPSEKAKAYRMKYDMLKHPGTKKGGMTLNNMAERESDGWKTIQRYIALSNLSETLLDMVDSGRLGIVQGVELSYLSKTEQELVFMILSRTKYRITKEKAKEIHRLSQNGQVNEETLGKVLSDNTSRKHSIKMEKIRQYFPQNLTDNEIEQSLFQILEAWNKKH